MFLDRHKHDMFDSILTVNALDDFTLLPTVLHL